ncbi:MAG: family 16 glycoside hydrolase [Pirellulales bacterium]
MAQGCEGDLIVIRGRDRSGVQIPATISSETVMGPDGRTRWKRGGTKTVYSGKQFWWNDHDPDFKELLDTRGRWDVSTAMGLWNRVECICHKDRITIIINSATVNECFAANPSAGRILLQSEGAEILFRNIELHPAKNSSD